jgi:hypothetical protein
MAGMAMSQAQCTHAAPSLRTHGPLLRVHTRAAAVGIRPMPSELWCSGARGRRSRAIRAEAATESAADDEERKKVVVVGAGWAGLGAAHHLTKQVSSPCPPPNSQISTNVGRIRALLRNICLMRGGSC